MRLVFYGTPDLAVPILTQLAENGTPPSLVVTRRDRPKGRGLSSAPSPVRAAAEARGIPVSTPARAGAPEEIARLAALKPDLIVLAAYGQILPAEVLSIPRLGALNVHFSLLPRHRGASPIQAAILAGDSETGVTTMWMTDKLDEGPVFTSLRTPIGAEENAGELRARLAELGARCLLESLARIERGEVVRESQDSARATYAPKFVREDARLSLHDAPAAFSRKVRAFTPEPGAYLDLEQGALQVVAASPGEGSAAGSTEPGHDTASTLAVAPGTVLALDRARGLLVSLGSGSVWLRRVRPSGRKEMGGQDYANGARLKPGSGLQTKPEPGQ